MSGQGTRFVWIRHAPTGISDRWIGRTDAPAVVPEPEALGPLWDALADVDQVICSPLIRARQTAAALFPDHAPIRDAALVEQGFGDWEDRFYADCPMPEGLDAAAIAGFAAPGGESFATVCDRIADAITGILRNHSGETVAIVAHAGVIRAALVHALGAPAASGITFQVAPLSLTRITLFADGASVETVNQTL